MQNQIPLSPQNTIKKSRQACLNAIFLLWFAMPRRRRGGMSERSDEIPERGIVGWPLYI